MNAPTDQLQPHWHILGMGAIGGLFACRLQNAGIAVSACPSPSTSAKSQFQLTLEEQGQQVEFHIPIHADSEITHLLLTTKAQQSESALRNIARRLHSNAVVVVLQNGLGVHEQLLNHWPSLSIVAATTTEGVNRPSPQHLRHAGHGTTWLGPWRGEDETAAQQVWSQWQSLALQLVYDASIVNRLWEKLVMNCAINPLTALLDCRNGTLEKQAATRAVIHAIVNEVSALMHACGYSNDKEQLYQKVLAVSRSTSANISSMLADQRAGRTTEIEFINGYVTRASRTHGLDAPINDWLMACVKAHQRFDAESLLRAMPIPRP